MPNRPGPMLTQSVAEDSSHAATEYPVADEVAQRRVRGSVGLFLTADERVTA